MQLLCGISNQVLPLGHQLFFYAFTNVTDDQKYSTFPQQNLPVLEFLVSEGANVDHTDKVGLTTLMMASNSGHLSVCEYLTSQNCDVTIQYNGYSALDIAKARGNENIVGLLKPLM